MFTSNVDENCPKFDLKCVTPSYLHFIIEFRYYNTNQYLECEIIIMLRIYNYQFRDMLYVYLLIILVSAVSIVKYLFAKCVSTYLEVEKGEKR